MGTKKGRPKRQPEVAESEHLISEPLQKLVIPTTDQHRHAVSLCHTGAHLEILSDDWEEYGTQRQSGAVIAFDDESAGGLCTQETEAICGVNVPAVYVLFSLLWREHEEGRTNALTKWIVIPASVLYRSLGHTGGINAAKRSQMDNLLQPLTRLVGVLTDAPEATAKRVLLYRGYSPDSDSYSFKSPYLSDLVVELDNMRKSRKAEANKKAEKSKRKRSAPPESVCAFSMLPAAGSHAQRLCEQIAFCVAAEMVVTLKKAGSKAHGCHISGKTLMEYIPQFRAEYERILKNHKTRFLNAVYSNAWNILNNDTTLKDEYTALQLPQPGAAECIPKARERESIVFNIRHSGKVKTDK